MTTNSIHAAVDDKRMYCAMCLLLIFVIPRCMTMLIKCTYSEALKIVKKKEDISGRKTLHEGHSCNVRVVKAGWAAPAVDNVSNWEILLLKTPLN